MSAQIISKFSNFLEICFLLKLTQANAYELVSLNLGTQEWGLSLKAC